MAARLVKVFHVRLNLQDGAASGPHPLAAFNKDAGAPRVRDPKAGAEAQGQLPLPPRPAKSDDSSVAVVRDDKARPEAQGRASVPPRAAKSDDSSVSVVRDDRARAEAKGPASDPPRAAKSDDSSIAVLRDEKLAVEDRKREENVQPILLDEPRAKWRKRDSEPDEPLSIRAIAVTMAAVIVVGFAFTLSLPSILTRGGAETTATITPPPSPVQPPPVQPTKASGSAPYLPVTLVLPSCPLLSRLNPIHIPNHMRPGPSRTPRRPLRPPLSLPLAPPSWPLLLRLHLPLPRLLRLRKPPRPSPTPRPRCAQQFPRESRPAIAQQERKLLSRAPGRERRSI